MTKIKFSFFIHFLFFFVFFFLSTSWAGDTFYTSYNIWYEIGKQDSLWCINYKTGMIIPAGTEVKEVEIIHRNSLRSPQITFVTMHDNRRFHVNFRKNFHPGKTIRDYLNMMFTEKNFTELVQRLNEHEVSAIKKGIIVLGMSKRAVVTSFGYPPEHKTPSVRDNVWMYWMNRFRSKDFYFDEKGETVYAVKM